VTTLSVPRTPSPVSIVHHIAEPITDILVAVQHGGVEHYAVVSLERPQPAMVELTLLPEPSVIEVAAVAQKAAQRLQVHALKARARGDRNTYTLLWSAARQLGTYAAGWRIGQAEESLPEREGVMV
jgi:hypothetical protein